MAKDGAGCATGGHGLIKRAAAVAPEYRRDPVTGRLVIIAPGRAERPHQFVESVRPTRNGPCPFCPGNEQETPDEVAASRPGETAPNGPGWQVRIVPNKFPAVVGGGTSHSHPGLGEVNLPSRSSVAASVPVSAAMPALGRHEVVIETDAHAVQTSEIPAERWTLMWRLVRERFGALRRMPGIRYVQWFKNVGDAAGASIEHAHGQMIGLEHVPEVPAAELAGAANHWRLTGRCIFCEVLSREAAEATRLVELTPRSAAWCSYAGRFSYEMIVAPRRHAADFVAQNDDDLIDAALLLHRSLARLERACPGVAYNVLLHTTPWQDAEFDGSESDYYHWHWEVLPRLTKAAGFEWGAGIHLNPVAPEQAAEALRNAKPD